MWVARLAFHTVTCNPMSASFDYAAESSHVRAVGCNLHLSLNCLPCTFNAKPVRMLKCYNDDNKNEECIFIDDLICSKTLQDVSVRSCEWFFLSPFAPFCLSLALFLLLLSCTWFKLIDCYKVSSTTSWLTYCCWHSLFGWYVSQ